MKIDQKFRSRLWLFVQEQLAIVFKTIDYCFQYCFGIFCNLIIPKQGIENRIFSLNGLWRFLKNGHLPVKLHLSAPLGHIVFVGLLGSLWVAGFVSLSRSLRVFQGRWESLPEGYSCSWKFFDQCNYTTIPNYQTQWALLKAPVKNQKVLYSSFVKTFCVYVALTFLNLVSACCGAKSNFDATFSRRFTFIFLSLRSLLYLSYKQTYFCTSSMKISVLITVEAFLILSFGFPVLSVISLAIFVDVPQSVNVAIAVVIAVYKCIVGQFWVADGLFGSCICVSILLLGLSGSLE